MNNDISKNELVNGKTPFFVIGPFSSAIRQKCESQNRFQENKARQMFVFRKI